MDISNGEGVGISLFVQGCHFHCNNCFNPETWDFNSGKEWTEEVENKFLELAARQYIKRISILGGDPLTDENLDGVLNLVNRIRLSFGNTKTIWLYTGYKVKDIYKNEYIILSPSASDIANQEPDYIAVEESKKDKIRNDIITQCDILVDGRYIDTQKDVTLKWRGSSNQRVIDIKRTLKQNEVILYCD